MTRPHLITIRLPNPFGVGRNCVYVLREDPVTIIDTGVATDKAYQGLVAGLREHGLTPADIQRIVLTHKHIDHIGNAWRVQQHSGAEIVIHESEVGAVTHVDPKGERHAQIVRERMEEWLIPEADRPSRSVTSGRGWEIEPATATPLHDGQRLPQGGGFLEIVHTPGHTVGSICLEYGPYLFSGDHVLPGVSPNIGGGDLRNRDLLRKYLDSLHKIRSKYEHESVQVMPGHGSPLLELLPRCQELIEHHEQRLDQIIEILLQHGAQTVHELAQHLFGNIKGFHVVLACAEAHAHLELLMERQRVEQHDGHYALLEQAL